MVIPVDFLLARRFLPAAAGDLKVKETIVWLRKPHPALPGITPNLGSFF